MIIGTIKSDTLNILENTQIKDVEGVVIRGESGDVITLKNAIRTKNGIMCQGFNWKKGAIE